jgi:hypothetical protein
MIMLIGRSEIGLIHTPIGGQFGVNVLQDARRC